MLMPVYNRFSINFVKGKGSYLYDDLDEKYLDFVSGIATNILGHSHPIIVNALVKQASTLMHISNLYYNDKQVALANMLVKNTDFEEVFFGNSGSEACELAIKIARAFGKKTNSAKSKIIYMSNSFHGRTTGSLAITGTKKYQTPFEPLMSNMLMCEFNNAEELKKLFDDDVCAIIFEVIQGEGGINTIDASFVSLINELANKHSALIMIDEIQTGIYRTNKLFAYQHFDLKPDVVLLAKGLGGGIPISATLITNNAVNVLFPGDHGSTFGGNPLVCQVSLAILSYVTKPKFIANCEQTSNYIHQKLKVLKAKIPELIEIRGIGLLIGLKFSDKINSQDLVKQALKNKLLFVGAQNNIIRILPPLNVSYQEIDEAIFLLERSIVELLHL